MHYLHVVDTFVLYSASIMLTMRQFAYYDALCRVFVQLERRFRSRNLPQHRMIVAEFA